jgi:hypothetical protein
LHPVKGSCLLGNISKPRPMPHAFRRPEARERPGQGRKIQGGAPRRTGEEGSEA